MSETTQKVRDLPIDLPMVNATVKYGVAVPGVDIYRYDVVDRSRTNLVFEPRQAIIRDATPVREALSLNTHGFALLRHRSDVGHLAAGPAAVGPNVDLLRDDYHREMIEFVRDIGATPHVFAQSNGFLIRHGSRSEVKTAARPASFAHCDFTPKTATQMAEHILRQHGLTLNAFRGFKIYQTWRAVTPAPQDTLLTFCDPRTVSDEDCITVTSIIGPEDKPENVFLMKMGTFRASHEWYYFSALTANDVIVFMAHDWQKQRQPNVLHTSFQNPAAGPTAVPRASIEARLFAYFE
jgi:hypothetical protein